MSLAIPDGLVPALVDGAQVFIECPHWCTLDHAAENEQHIEDVHHLGEFSDLEMPRMDGTSALLAFARLGMDPYGDVASQREAFLVVDDPSASGVYMRAEQAEQFADKLEAFAAQIRAMAGLLRVHEGE